MFNIVYFLILYIINIRSYIIKSENEYKTLLIKECANFLENCQIFPHWYKLKANFLINIIHFNSSRITKCTLVSFYIIFFKIDFRLVSLIWPYFGRTKSYTSSLRFAISPSFPENKYVLKVNYWSTRIRTEICSKLTIKTPERRQWRHSGDFIVNFELCPTFFWCFHRWLWTGRCCWV